MAKVNWQPPSGFRRVANIPQQFSRGTVHIGIVTGIKRRNEPGAAATVIGAYIDFKAPRQGFLKASDAEKIAHGQRVRVEVEKAYPDHEGFSRFDLKLLEILPREEIQAPKPTAKSADPWAGFKRMEDWIIFPPEAAKGGLPGLYARRFEHIAKVENSGEILNVKGADYHVMVPQGFTEAMESIYGMEVFELQLMAERQRFRISIMYNVCHPDFPDISLGLVEVENEYGFKIGDKVKLRDVTQSENGGDFAGFLDLRATKGETGFLFVPPNIGTIYSSTIYTTYVHRGSRNGPAFLGVKIPTCLLLGQTSGRVEFVVVGVDEDDHRTGCPTMAYPGECDGAIANLKDMFNGVEADLFVMSAHGVRGDDVEQWPGHDVRVDYNGSTFAGFLICDEPLASFDQTVRRRIKFTQMGAFTADKEQLTRLLFQTPYFELVD